jgi:hypothetical protein
VKEKKLTDLESSVAFLNRAIPNKCFFDLYIDINDEDVPCWQESFVLQGCQNKQEVIDFITKLYENGFI